MNEVTPLRGKLNGKAPPVELTAEYINGVHAEFEAVQSENAKVVDTLLIMIFYVGGV